MALQEDATNKHEEIEKLKERRPLQGYHLRVGRSSSHVKITNRALNESKVLIESLKQLCEKTEVLKNIQRIMNQQR